jgi:hypothetical protein
VALKARSLACAGVLSRAIARRAYRAEWLSGQNVGIEAASAL